MSHTPAYEMTQPSYTRTGVNAGATTIPKAFVVKRTSAELGAALATATSDSFAGVAIEDMPQNIARSIQVDGIAIVTAGASCSVGDKLTVDSAGRVVPVTGSSQNVVGIACQAATGANDLISVELTKAGLGNSSTVYKKSLTIGYADLTAAAISQAFNIGAVLPTGARPIGWDLKVTEAFVKAAQTFTAVAGISGTTNKYVTSQDISTGVNEFAGALGPKVADGEQWILTITTNTGTVASSTAGALTLEILYTVPATSN